MEALQGLSLGFKFSAWPTLLDIGLPLQRRLALVGVAQLLVALHQYFLVRRLRYSGLHRFLASVPSLVLLTSFAYLFNWQDEVLLRTSILFTCTWLGSFKLVGACINRGPLAQEEERTFLQFYMLLYLPIFPSSGLLVFVTWCIQHLDLPKTITHYFYSLALVGFLGILMDAPASIATSLVGLAIIPTFDAPWFSSSLADFWGRRWNITTSAILRTLIYDPIVEGRLMRPHNAHLKETSRVARVVAEEPAADNSNSNGHTQNGHDSAGTSDRHTGTKRTPKWRRVVGTFATFFVSGIVHEYIINMVNPALPDGSMPWLGKWTAFFTLQAPMLLGEVQLKKWWKQRGFRQPNLWLARFVTTGLLILVAGPLFFAPCDTDSDLADRCIGSVLGCAGYVAREAKTAVLAVLASMQSTSSKEL